MSSTTITTTAPADAALIAAEQEIASAPDLFALGGQSERDPEERDPLIELERRLIELSSESDALLKIENPTQVDENGYPVGWQELRDQVIDLDDLILETPPQTLAGAAVKLRRLLDPESGLPSCAPAECHYDSLRQVLAIIGQPGAGGAA